MEHHFNLLIQKQTEWHIMSKHACLCPETFRKLLGRPLQVLSLSKLMHCYHRLHSHSVECRLSRNWSNVPNILFTFRSAVCAVVIRELQYKLIFSSLLHSVLYNNWSMAIERIERCQILFSKANCLFVCWGARRFERRQANLRRDKHWTTSGTARVV